MVRGMRAPWLVVFLVAAVLPVLVPARAGAGPLPKGVRKCRKTLDKNIGKYITTGLKVLSGCYKAGLAGKIPDASVCASVATGDAKGKIQKAAMKAGAGVGKCSGLGVADIGALEQCPFPCQSLGVINDLAAVVDCQLCLATADIEELTAAQFGSVVGGLDKAERGCLNGLAKAADGYTKTVLKTLAKCHESVDAGKSMADCTDPAQNDPRGKITKALAKLQVGVAKKCSDSVLGGLDVCAGTGTNLIAAKSCLANLHTSVSSRDAHTIASRCGLDGLCDFADEDSTSCPADCGPAVSASVQTIFSGSCALAGCHDSLTAAQGMILEEGVAGDFTIDVDATEVVMKRVMIGSSAGSWLFSKISTATPAVGGRMPLGFAPLSATDQNTIRDWIDNGLFCGDTSCDFAGNGETRLSCPRDCGPTVPANVQVIFTTSCALSGCHDSFTVQQGLDLSARGAGAHTVGRAATEMPGSQLVTTGSSAASWLFTKISQTTPAAGAQMPFGLPPLSAADQQTIKDWIDNGAPPG